MADIFPGAKIVQAAGFTARATPNPTQAWSVIHTAASLASAEALALRHSTNPPPGSVSASFWVNRDGSVVQSMTNPRLQAPWTNGVWQNPDLTNPRIRAARLAGVNPNIRTLVSIENVSLEPGAPITSAQEATNAKIVAWAHALIGMPVTRQTVIGHYQITATDRPNCPARNKSVIDRIVALAAGADVSKSTATITLYPDGPHNMNIPAGGKVDGYSLDGLVKSQTFPGGSSFPADGTAVITQDPQKAPNGTFRRCTAGIFAGLFIPHTQVIDVGPINPPPPGLTQADVDAAAKAAADAVAGAADQAASEF